MRKILFISLIVAIAYILYLRHTSAKTEEQLMFYKANTETLLAQAEEYRTSAGNSAMKTKELTLKIKEFEQYRAEDAKLIEELRTKHRDIAQVSNAVTETNRDFVCVVHDTLLSLHTDTVRCIDVKDEWMSLSACIDADTLNGNIQMRDSLLITETVQYKRFLGFLWKTKKIKNREFDIVSKNPHTTIKGYEVITIGH